jgi:SAM-dependent methyltransferase
MINSSINCKLCCNNECEIPNINHWRKYIYCPNCTLLFVDPIDWIDTDKEIERYNLHNNDIGNSGYVSYLDKFKKIIIEHSPINAQILDFGSGKNAVLSRLMDKNVYKIDSYDPLFDRMLKDGTSKYDMVVLCEVVEHLKNLNDEIRLIQKLLKNNGKIVIRTRLYHSIETVPSWWYAQDKTHINFFSIQSLSELARQLNRNLFKTEFDDIFLIS